MDHGDQEELHETIRRYGRQIETIQARGPSHEASLTEAAESLAFLAPTAALRVRKLLKDHYRSD